MRFEGDALHLNVDASALGLVRVELQKPDGQPIPVFALADCDRIHTANTVDRVATWKDGHASLADVKGESVRVRFELRFGAKLYSFQFTPGT